MAKALPALSPPESPAGLATAEAALVQAVFVGALAFCCRAHLRARSWLVAGALTSEVQSPMWTSISDSPFPLSLSRLMAALARRDASPRDRRGTGSQAAMPKWLEWMHCERCARCRLAAARQMAAAADVLRRASASTHVASINLLLWHSSKVGLLLTLLAGITQQSLLRLGWLLLTVALWSTDARTTRRWWHLLQWYTAGVALLSAAWLTFGTENVSPRRAHSNAAARCAFGPRPVPQQRHS